MNEKNDIEIGAKTIEEFNKLFEKISTLSESVKSQIQSASNGLVGIECIIPYDHSTERTIYLPFGVSQIAHLGDYIGIYCGDFFFKVIIHKNSDKISFVFEQPKNKEQE